MEKIAKQLKLPFLVLAFVSVLALAFWAFRTRGQSNCSSVVLCGTTGSIGGGLLAVGGSATGTASVTGASVGMPCFAQPSDGTNIPALGMSVGCTVTANGTVTVNLVAMVVVTPPAKTYVVRVLE